MSYYDGLNSVQMFGAGAKSKVDAREDIEFQFRTGRLGYDEYHGLMDAIGVALPERRYGAKAYGINSSGTPFYVEGTGWMYR